MVVKVTAPTYKSIEGRRQSEIIVEGLLKIDMLSMSFRDQSKFNGQVEAEKVDIVLRQQSNVKIYGTTKDFDVELQDQSGLKGKSLQAAVVNIKMDNQTNASVFASKSIDGYVRGMASLSVEGEPAKSNLEKSKMAEIEL